MGPNPSSNPVNEHQTFTEPANQAQVSDYTADEELICHGFAADGRDAARLAFRAGVDMSMQSGLYVQHMQDLVAKGDVSMEEVDEGVRRILKIKKAIGLFLGCLLVGCWGFSFLDVYSLFFYWGSRFDNPYKCLDPKLDERLEKLRSDHEPLAREAGRKSIVLLKNEGKVLPLKKSGQKIALIGPFGSDTQNLQGCWTVYGDKKRAVPVDVGLRQALSKPEDLEMTTPNSNENDHHQENDSHDELNIHNSNDNIINNVIRISVMNVTIMMSFLDYTSSPAFPPPFSSSSY